MSPARSRELVTGLALAVGVFVLYVSTYSSVPTADGYTYLSWIDGRDYRGILNTTSALTGYGFFSLKRALTWLGVPLRTLMLIQIVNALVAGAGVAVFYKTLRILGANHLLGVLGAALLATSFGYWYFANGEFQHVSLLVLLVIFYRLVRERAAGGGPGVRSVVVLGALNAIAVLFRQENFLFGFAAVGLLTVGRPLREGLRNGVLYAAVGSVSTGILVFLVGHFLLDLSTLEGFGRWYLWLAEYVQHPQDYQAFESRLAFDLPRVVKGQLTAITVGTQVVADAALRRTDMTQAKVIVLLALTVVAYALMIVLLTDAWHARHRLRDSRLAAVTVACVVWIVAYKLIVHGWWWPTVTKYQVVTVPPLIVLLILGTLVMQANAAVTPQRASARMWPVAVLLVVLFTVNAWGGIVPWYRYGRMKDAIVMRQVRDFGHDDLFISSESGLDGVFQRGPNHVEVKNVFLRLPEKEAFRTVETTIAEELSKHRRVYVYNFVPSPFTLIGINQAAVRGSEHLDAADFERFFARLQEAYTLRPVFSYWEETKTPMYLFGERLEPFWEVTPRR